MAAPTTQSFADLVRNQVTAIQTAASTLVDFTIGSILRAIVEANAALMLWLQGLILTLLQSTRAATSSGTDLDSWMADFALTRLPGQAATGTVTFSRFTANLQAVVPVGATAQTADGTVTYDVVEDDTDPHWSSTLNGYVLGVNIGGINVPVVAEVVGSVGNAVAGAISVLTTAIPGVDTVSNASQFVTGADAESDDDFRARFVTYIASLSKATKAAVGNAILSVEQGLSYSLTENESYGGTFQPGYFYVIVDDGSGAPPSDLLTAVNAAIDTVRPLTVTFGVFAPVVVTATVAITVTAATGYQHAPLATVVQSAIAAYIASLSVGATLVYTRLIQIAYDASPGVANVSGLTINSGTSDITATAKQVVRAGTISVS